ncbi:hypothetical protein BaRGS_00034578 [Batillaria attramentaria]|uniref:Fibronectin type-III domain-containing protein n=1 Tax=Batillaria attramentaria TaxID=370345 RepID=A0ABD0JGY6_9CAEN
MASPMDQAPSTVIKPPKFFRIESKKNDTIKFKWSAPEDQPDEYRLEARKGESGRWDTIGTTKTRTFTAKQLERESSYDFRVMAIKKVPSQPAVLENVSLSPPPTFVAMESVSHSPPPPQSLAMENVSLSAPNEKLPPQSLTMLQDSDFVTLCWSAPTTSPGPSKYVVEVNDLGEWKKVPSSSLQLTNVARSFSAKIRKSETGLNHPYFSFRVKAHYGGQAFSEPVETDCKVCSDLRGALIRNITFMMDKLLKKPDDLLKALSAFMNDGGGVVFIHATDPHDLGELDKAIDDKLRKLIPDNNLFDQMFERHFDADPHHIKFRVYPRERNSPLSTYCFNSPISLNKGIEEPTHAEMLKFLKALTNKSVSPPEKNPPKDREDDDVGATVYGKHVENNEVLGNNNKYVFQEDSRTQAKDVDRRKGERQEIPKDFFNKMMIGKYISAFSKARAGGAVHLGIEEEKKNSRFRSRGFLFPTNEVRERVKDEVFTKILDSMFWYGLPEPKSCIEIEFCPVEADPQKMEQGDARQLYVVEVKISYYEGVAFSKACGPEAYTFSGPPGSSQISDNVLRQMTFDEWLQENKLQDLDEEMHFRKYSAPRSGADDRQQQDMEH